MAYNYEYPYTDPYRYNDDWLLRKMRDLIEEWAAMKKQFDDLNQAFNDLKTYVMNYFENLDVQQEVEVVLNKWLADGTIQNLINNYLMSWKGGFWTQKVGIILLGGDLWVNSIYSGLNLATLFSAQLYFSPSALLVNAGSSLMQNGALSYYEVSNAWKLNHPNYINEGYRFLFVCPDRSDWEYSSGAIIQNLINLRNNFKGLIPVLIPYIFPNYNPSSSDITLRNLYNNLEGSGFYRWKERLTIPDITGSYNNYINPQKLSINGINQYLSFLVNDWIFPTIMEKHRIYKENLSVNTGSYIEAFFEDVGDYSGKLNIRIVFGPTASLQRYHITNLTSLADIFSVPITLDNGEFLLFGKDNSGFFIDNTHVTVGNAIDNTNIIDVPFNLPLPPEQNSIQLLDLDVEHIRTFYQLRTGA